ncbi:MAG: hydratase [Deltaproteobacteria bacterium]|jgi:aconitate hydratase|nr:hydratase [Deltaproteobacteria bacterium]
MTKTLDLYGASCLRGGRLADAGPEDVRGAGTMAHAILAAHRLPGQGLTLRFDALASHDITYVGVVQTVRASGLRRFPLPYLLANCHNSLCAVGGTINEDDHLYGLSAAKKYGGDFLPPHLAVIHQYVREMIAGCGKMILGSDSHTRYGALGCMGIGEGGPELVNHLLGRGYALASMPEVTAVWLEGAPQPGVGPQDVALSLIKAVFAGGLVKNHILEFLGPGVENLSVDFRLSLDVMTTETSCLSSIWRTDEKVRQWLAAHRREEDYKELQPADGACYAQALHVDLSRVRPMIALPFHPSNAWPIEEFLENAEDLLAGVEQEARNVCGCAEGSLRSKLRGGGFYADQAIVAGCSGGTYENVAQMARMLEGKSIGADAFSLSVYPASQPQYLALLKNGYAASLLEAGATIKTAFCGPCFGAGDVPANNAFSIRHVTRNFPNREGSNPVDGQMAYVALMDARSIAATALNKGRLTPATALENPPGEEVFPYIFDRTVYDKRVYRGFGRPEEEEALIFGPGIRDWPPMPALPENLLLGVASAIYDPVTTTDELIPSGETSSYRSDPLRLAAFALHRKDPGYVGRAKTLAAWEQSRRAGSLPEEATAVFKALGVSGKEGVIGIGSLIFAVMPGDGSAREQAASCQKVLGGWANIAVEYAAKRYRGNLVNWGLLPFVAKDAASWNLAPGDFLYIPGIRQLLTDMRNTADLERIAAVLLQNGEQKPVALSLPGLTGDECDVIAAGCLMNQCAISK